MNCEIASDQRLLNCGARRAAFRRRKLRIPRPAAGGRSRSLRCASSPHESRCACFRGDPFPIKYEVRSQSRKKAPSMRTALLVCNKQGNQRLLNCGARRAAFRRRKLRIPRPAAGGRSRSLRCASSPHESRCACFRGDPFPIKYEVRSQSRKKAPSMRTALLVCNKPGDQRLLNCGARRAALRPYCFLP